MERYPWQRPEQKNAEEEGSGYDVARAVGKAVGIADVVGTASYGLGSLFPSRLEEAEAEELDIRRTPPTSAVEVGISSHAIASNTDPSPFNFWICHYLEELAETSRKVAKALESHGNLSTSKMETWTGAVAQGLEVGGTPIRPLRPKSAITRWQPPEYPWYKLNTDGTSRPQMGLSGAGGLIRDHTGKYHVGFFVRLKLCSSFEAESWGAYYGLSLAWSRGFKRIILETDNQGVCAKITEIIERKGLIDYPADTPMDKIQRLLGNVWEEVKVIFKPRKVNKCADRLADMAVDKNMLVVMKQPIVMEEPPADKRFKKVLSKDSKASVGNHHYLEELAETSRKAAKALESHRNLSTSKMETWTGAVAQGLEVGGTPIRPLRPKSTITRWQPPEYPWYKLNTDGTSRPKMGLSGAGGLIRDHTGKYHVGFFVRLKLCDSFEAESWGAYYGLSLAWSRGFKRIILETDNQGVCAKITEIIERKGLIDYPAGTPMDKIQRLLGNVWEEVKVISKPRKVNKCADRLADMAVDKNVLFVMEQPLVIRQPPADKRFMKVLSKDSNGISATK